MKNSFPKKIIFFSLCILFFIGIHFLGFLTSVETFIRRGITPISSWFYSFKTLLVEKEHNSKNQDDPRILKKRIEELLQQQATLKLALYEDETLRKQLDFFSSHSYDHRTARIIGKNPDSQRSGIILDKGFNDGIRDGMPVIVDNGVLIGKIIHTESTISHVLLLNDAKSKVITSILGDKKISGIVNGNFNLGLMCTLISVSEIIKENDVVATAGLEKDIPSGLVIGTVSSIEKKPADLFQSAVISPLVDYNTLSVVTVLITH